ncbi:MAG: hypothetical protein N2111_12360 [Candidatus Sumerlaeaceae bacterium]|nr:hypothetical protein [Candidatus Sumerlaeaceae bacterium]
MKKWLCAVAVVSALGSSVRAEEATAAPDVKMNEALVTVVVSDIPGLVQQAGDLAGKVQPSISAEMIKNQVGTMLGDPELEGLPKGSDAAFVAFQPVQILFVEVGGGKAEAYAKKAEENGQMAAATDGVVVIAKTEEALAAGKKLAPEVKSKLLAASKPPAVTVSVEMPRVFKQFGPQIEGGLTMMTASMRQAAEETTGAEAAKLVEGYVRFALAMAKQMERLELTVDLPAEGVRVTKTITPVAGTNLATYLAAPAPKAEDLLKLLPATGAMRAQYVMDAKSLAVFVEKEIKPIAKEIGLDDATVGGLMDLIKKAGSAYSGSFAIDAVGGGEGYLDGAAAYSVSDPAAAMALIEDSVAQFEKKGGLGDIYKQMGMTMKVALKKDARKHKDIAIHELNMKMEAEGNPEIAKLLADGFKYQVAMVGKVQLLAMGDTKIEPLIDAALKGDLPASKPLAAQKLMPSGAAFLMDIDVSRYIGYIAALAAKAGEKDAKMDAIVEKLSGAEPLTLAGGVTDGKIVGRMLVPVSLMEKIGKVAAEEGGSEPEASDKDEKPAEQTAPTE